MSSKLKIMMVAGEPSGDTHGAKLAAALQSMVPERAMELFGSAGPKMRQAGVQAVVQADSLSVVGLAEIAGALPMFVSAFRELKAAALQHNPDAIVLIDFPDFNLKLARSLKRKGYKVIYYISPQLWAWRKYRLRSVKKNVDLMLTILPFEQNWYEKNGFTNVRYVGSPLVREIHVDTDKTAFCKKHSLDADRPIVSLLPGSREKEITRILPVLLDAANEVLKANADAQFLIPLSSESHREIVDILVRSTRQSKVPLTLVSETFDALNASDVAAVTSGTATLEAGIIGTPMAVVYKTSSLNYRLLEPLISVPHYGLINLIAGRRVANELIQNEFTAKTLSAELIRLLRPDVNAKMREELKETADGLGHGGASKRAAEAIMQCIDEKIVLISEPEPHL